MKLYETLQTKNAGYVRARFINPIGIFVHSTGATNPELRRYVDAPDLLGKNLYGNHWNKGTATKSMHAFIGLDKNKEVAVCHTLPYNIACWGAGGGSNGSYNYDPQAHIQFEVCEDNAPRSGKPPTAEQTEYFKNAWLAAEEYCTYLCQLLNLPASAIVGHYEAAKRGFASYHSDPENWLKIYGDSMDKFRARVAKRLQGDVVQPKPPEPKPEPKPEPEQPKTPLPATVKMQIKNAANAAFFGVPLNTVISLPIEEYLMGVVPAEVGNAPIEAGIAQAIAARSILLSGRWADVITDTTSHQAYSGARSVDPDFFRAHQAVKDSKGVVLLYNGKIASCFYADSNGGKMVASDMHWNQKIPYEQREHIPYLVTKDDPWTLASGKPFNGHPVGMSQQGAIYAANQGIKHDKILAFYYPGTVLSNKVVATPDQPPTPPVEPSYDVLYRAQVVTKNPLSLNIWQEARKGTSLAQVPRGAVVEVLQEVNKTWAKVRYNGAVGYSDRQYLKKDPPYKAAVKTMYPLSLNIWEEPKKGTSLGKIPNGATVMVLAEVNSTWAKVQYGNVIGYSDRQYLKQE